MLRSMVRARGGAAIRAGAGCRQVDGATDANSGSLLATDTTVHKMSFSTTLAGTAAVSRATRGSAAAGDACIGWRRAPRPAGSVG